MFGFSGSNLPFSSSWSQQPLHHSNISRALSSPSPSAITPYGIMELAHSKTLIASLALATHYALHRSDWDNTFHTVIGVWTVAFGGIATLEYVADTSTKSLGVAIQLAARTATFYFAILIASILLHRGFFHRLRKASASLTLIK